MVLNLHIPIFRSMNSMNHLLKRSSSTSRPFQIFFNDVYKVSLPDNHKFPMDKYSMVRERLSKHVEGNTMVQFQQSPIAKKTELETTHCKDYVNRVLNGELTAKEVRATGFPWTEAGVKRSLSSVGGTIAGMREVLNPSSRKISAQLAGGTHHAFYDRGEGFCTFSDIAVAANLALNEYPHVKNILILDLDVHQGNGNAALFRHNPNVITFSMHCSGNIFSAREQSDIDVDLPNGTHGQEYLKTLNEWLPKLCCGVNYGNTSTDTDTGTGTGAGTDTDNKNTTITITTSQPILPNYQFPKPDLIFYQAGVDILGSDRLGKLNLSRDDCRLRNEIVYQIAKKERIPIVVTMGGGYPKDLTPNSETYEQVIGAHCDVYAQILSVYND
jgi:acetoin utilization deacetylase AcuC-like enzyme